MIIHAVHRRFGTAISLNIRRSKQTIIQRPNSRTEVARRTTISGIREHRVEENDLCGMSSPRQVLDSARAIGAVVLNEALLLVVVFSRCHPALC